MKKEIKVLEAETVEHYFAVHKLRQRVLFGELRYSPSAFEESWALRKANMQGKTFLALNKKDEAVGTLTYDWWHGLNANGPEAAHYQLGKFTQHFPGSAIATVRKWIVLPSYRKTPAALSLAEAVLRCVAEHDEIEFLIIDCAPDIVRKYEILGFRPYASRFMYGDGTETVPMCLVLKDHEYLRRSKAALFRRIVKCGYPDQSGARAYGHLMGIRPSDRMAEKGKEAASLPSARGVDGFERI